MVDTGFRADPSGLRRIGTFTWRRQTELAERMDPGYWDPVLLEQIEQLRHTSYPLVTIGELDPLITYGPIVTGGPPPSDKARGPYFIDTRHFEPTGLAPLAERVPRGSRWDVPRCYVQFGDVLLVRAGVATLGRVLVYLDTAPAIVGCYVDLIRQEKLDPCYLALFLKSPYGQWQIERFKSGVGTVNLSFQQIRAIQIPLLPESFQRQLACDYCAMDRWHRQGDQRRAEAKLQAALERLEELMTRFS